MAGIGRRAVCHLNGLVSRGCVRKNFLFNVRSCSSGNALQDSQTVKLTDPTKNPDYQKEVERFKDISDPDQNYFYHGYNPHDRHDDTFWHHHTMLFGVTMCFVGGMFIFAYLPDSKLQHWRQREAYLELARRESQGLPLIDPDLVPREKMLQWLPSDEELGDTEIIV